MKVVLGRNLMEKWKRHIETGHRLFAHQNFKEAKFHYQMACKRSVSLASEYGDERSTVMAVIVSHHGLADLYIEVGLPSMAQYEVEKLHHHLRINLNKPDLTEERRAVFLYGLQRTYTLLLQYMAGSGGGCCESSKMRLM